jgi:hypothetical protein
LRARFAALSATAHPAVARSSTPVRPIVKVGKLPAPPRLASPVVPNSVNSPRLAQREKAIRQALCEAYKNNVPGYPSICAAAGPAP